LEDFLCEAWFILKWKVVENGVASGHFTEKVFPPGIFIYPRDFSYELAERPSLTNTAVELFISSVHTFQFCFYRDYSEFPYLVERPSRARIKKIR